MAEPEPTSDLPLRSEEGVDLTLIRWMLSLTPSERLAVLDDRLAFLQQFRKTDEAS